MRCQYPSANAPAKRRTYGKRKETKTESKNAHNRALHGSITKRIKFACREYKTECSPPVALDAAFARVAFFRRYAAIAYQL